MFCLYLFLWFIFSMDLSVEITVAGLILSGAVYWFSCRHMRYKPANERKLLRHLLRGVRYVVILIRELAKSNFSVFRIVFSRKIKVEPRIIFFRTKLKTNAARVVLANSITLTPGTITVALNDDLFCVHCLNDEMAEQIDDSVFVRQLLKFEEAIEDGAEHIAPGTISAEGDDHERIETTQKKAKANPKEADI